MMAAHIIQFAFMGRYIQRFVAVLAGIGFGLFIDEVGKFITRDNNYFFRPSIGIIYAILVSLYLIVSYLTREQKYTSQEYQVNALRQLEEAVRQDMDIQERSATRKLLSKAKQHDPVTVKLRELINELPIVPLAQKSYFTRMKLYVGNQYENLWMERRTRKYVQMFFIIETVLFLVAVLLAVYSNIDDVYSFITGNGEFGRGLIVGQFGSTLVAALCIIIGLRWLATSRLRAFEWFRRATLINLLLTEFFLFSRIQLGAVPSFMFNLALFILLDIVLSYERRAELERKVLPNGSASK